MFTTLRSAAADAIPSPTMFGPSPSDMHPRAAMASIAISLPADISAQRPACGWVIT